jgi:hypothetical protein
MTTPNGLGPQSRLQTVGQLLGRQPLSIATGPVRLAGRACLGGRGRRNDCRNVSFVYRAACPLQVTQCGPVAHTLAPSPRGGAVLAHLWSR